MNDRLAEADLRQERVLKEKNAIIRMKDEEISELKAKMDDMAEEFGEMLRVCFLFCIPIFHVLIQYFFYQETLEKMRERIEISNNHFDGPEMLIQNRMEELKLTES